MNLRFQHPTSPICSHNYTIYASLVEAIENSIRKASPKSLSPHHLSVQNFTLFPFPTLKVIFLLKPSHPLLIAFHTLTPYHLVLTPVEHHPPSSSPYFPEITCFKVVLNKSPHLLAKQSFVEDGQTSNTQTPTFLLLTN